MNKVSQTSLSKCVSVIFPVIGPRFIREKTYKEMQQGRHLKGDIIS